MRRRQRCSSSSCSASSSSSSSSSIPIRHSIRGARRRSRGHRTVEVTFYLRTFVIPHTVTGGVAHSAHGRAPHNKQISTGHRGQEHATRSATHDSRAGKDHAARPHTRALPARLRRSQDAPASHFEPTRAARTGHCARGPGSPHHSSRHTMRSHTPRTPVCPLLRISASYCLARTTANQRRRHRPQPTLRCPPRRLLSLIHI